MKNKKSYDIKVALLCLIFVAMTGCVASLPERTQVASQTIINPTNGDEVTFDVGEVQGGPTQQSLILGSLRLKTKEPQKAFERSIVTKGPAVPQNTGSVASQPPAKSPRGKKANLVPAPAPRAPPSQSTVVILERGWYPQNIPLANAGGTVQGWLVGGVEKFIGNIPFAFSGFMNPVPKFNMQQGQTANSDAKVNNKITDINTNINQFDINNKAIIK